MLIPLQIQQQLELLVNRGTSLSDLAFLRILQVVHQQTAHLVEDLRNFELPAVIPRSPVDKTDFPRQLSAAAAGSAATAATAVTVTAMLETAMEELFVPYTEGQRYLERESKSLSELYASFLTNFTRYHVCSYFSSCRTVDLYYVRNEPTKGASHHYSTAW